MSTTAQLFTAIQSDDIATIQNLISQNPELVNSKDQRGFTPLIFATYFDKDAIARFLLEEGADIDAQDASGNTALIGVSFKGNQNIAKILIEKGAKLNVQNKMGQTALIFSSLYNKEQSVDLLLEHNADKAIKDNSHMTAYDHAKSKGFDHLLPKLKVG